MSKLKQRQFFLFIRAMGNRPSALRHAVEGPPGNEAKAKAGECGRKGERVRFFMNIILKPHSGQVQAGLSCFLSWQQVLAMFGQYRWATTTRS
ncbi:MAG: hypothetical protein KDJ67_15270 [Nitratireductor sp.]|nr:hypothetical protein [Nitratireductor sp.]